MGISLLEGATMHLPPTVRASGLKGQRGLPASAPVSAKS